MAEFVLPTSPYSCPFDSSSSAQSISHTSFQAFLPAFLHFPSNSIHLTGLSHISTTSSHMARTHTRRSTKIWMPTGHRLALSSKDYHFQTNQVGFRALSSQRMLLICLSRVKHPNHSICFPLSSFLSFSSNEVQTPFQLQKVTYIRNVH